MARRVRKADPFDVWGKPPPSLRGNKKREDALRRYILRVVKKVYRIAYDAGASSVVDHLEN